MNSKDVESLLVLLTILILLSSMVVVSAKTGQIMGASLFTLAKEPLKFKVDRTKISTFMMLLCMIFAVSTMLIFCITQYLDLAFEFALFNTIIISYPLTYWVLLKEEAKKQ